MRRTIPIAIMVMAAACHPVSHDQPGDGRARGESSEQLARIERLWAQAYARRDTAEIGRLLADEFTDIDEDGVSTKAQYLSQTAGFGPTSESIVLSEERFRVYGDAAVTTGRLRWQSDPPSNAGYYTAVYVRRSARWQAVAFQLTPAHPA